MSYPLVGVGIGALGVVALCSSMVYATIILPKRASRASSVPQTAAVVVDDGAMDVVAEGDVATTTVTAIVPEAAENADAPSPETPADEEGDVIAVVATVDSEAAAPAMAGDGRDLFLQGATPACAVCHTLADAGSAGEIGPNLDDLKPTAARAYAAIRAGVGVMPAYSDTLDDEAMRTLAVYVATATGADASLP